MGIFLARAIYTHDFARVMCVDRASSNCTLRKPLPVDVGQRCLAADHPSTPFHEKRRTLVSQSVRQLRRRTAAPCRRCLGARSVARSNFGIMHEEKEFLRAHPAIFRMDLPTPFRANKN